MHQSLSTAIVVGTIATLVHRKLAKRTAAQTHSYWMDQLNTQCTLSFNRGYGEGHARGVYVEQFIQTHSYLPN